MSSFCLSSTELQMSTAKPVLGMEGSVQTQEPSFPLDVASKLRCKRHSSIVMISNVSRLCSSWQGVSHTVSETAVFLFLFLKKGTCYIQRQHSDFPLASHYISRNLRASITNKPGHRAKLPEPAFTFLCLSLLIMEGLNPIFSNFYTFRIVYILHSIQEFLMFCFVSLYYFTSLGC